MTVSAWRIVKAGHARTAFTGDGARQAGGRWNSPGTRVVYAAGSLSLAMLEMLVHLQSRQLLQRYVTFHVQFDEALMAAVDPADLPRRWRVSPPPHAVQAVGDEWIAAGTSPVLRVPSVIVTTEWNYLLNPDHPDFSRIDIGEKRPIKFDARLARKR
jgi:RES domain-containing protein